MISRQYAAWLAMCAIYDDAGRAAIFDKVLKVGNDVIGIKVIADTFTITPEGTFDWELWRDNIDFIPVNHPVWGGVHGEFLEAAQAIYAVVKPLALASGKDIAIQGHSRAGSLADALASLFALDGHKTTLSIFEAARFGWQKYSDWAQRQNKNGIINLVTSTRNGPDFIVDLPPFPWVATYPQLDLKYAPGGLKDAIPTEWHMSDAVYPGYLKLFPPA
jgi:hypothetical protein